MKKLLANQFRKTGAVAGGYMGLFGFIADILSPIAPFSSYLFFASAFMVVFFLIIMVVKSTLQEKIAPALVFSITLLVISGLLYAVQEEPETGSTNYGVLATQIPALQTLQSSLGLIQEDVAAIRESTENIDQTTARTEQVVKQVEINTKENTEATKQVADAVVESTKQIVGSLEEMQKGFTSLTQAGGVIANPTRPEQFYHNARIQELGGDYGNARQSYNKYFTFKLDFIDPHLRYQSFLKIQEGRAGARELYSYLYENDPRPIVEYARILLFDAPERTQMLEDFIKSNPDFAPAYYELSKEYSQARKGTQSLSDKKAEYKALEQFEALNKEGKLFKYFVDKETVSKWVDYAEQSLKNMPLIHTLVSSPVKIISGRSNQGWSHRIEISEIVREIFYRIDDDTNFKSTGFFDDDNLNQVTGEPRAISTIKMPLKVTSASIFIKYIDINKKEKGPYEFQFDAYTTMVKRAKRLTKSSADNWVAYPSKSRYKQNFRNLTFNSLITKRCGINKILYGKNTKQLHAFKTIKLGECDYEDDGSLRDGEFDKSSFNSTNIDFVSIQVEYRDGTTSKIHTFENPNTPVVKTERYANGQKKFDGNYKDLGKFGDWIWWHENGQIKTEGRYGNKKVNPDSCKYTKWCGDCKEGNWTEWHENGQKKSFGKYNYGGYIGTWTWWHENGQMKKKGSYSSVKSDPRNVNWVLWCGDCKTGQWIEWYENGEIKSQKYYEHYIPAEKCTNNPVHR